VVRKAVICGLCAGVAAVLTATASAALPRGQTLMPGVTYTRQLEFTGHGPVALNILTAPRPVGLYALKPILSNNAVLGRERVTSMQRRVSGDATVAGVNGDRFSLADGHPTGTLIRDGVLDASPMGERSSVGIDTDGTLHVDRVSLAGTWQGSGQRRILDVNEPPRPGRTTLYTRAWGARTPADSGGAYAVLQPFPATTPNTPLTATVTGFAPGGNQAIPPDGAVLVARGAQAGFLSAEAPLGSKVTILLLLTPAWTNVPQAVGGGPIIVRDGRPVYRAFETFDPAQLTPRTARTAVGQLADGRLVFVAADGSRPGYSTGLTNFELALTMMRLGCVTASALDSGGSTTMAFDGKLLNRPSDRGGERAVADAPTLFYYGAYVPPLADRTLAAGGTVPLSYKLVRPSTVIATLVGPGGAGVALASGARAPGVYRFNWASAGQPAGAWTFRVVADDDQGRRSTAERDFTLK
jgi:Phosphodiester glycosidase